MKRVVEKTSKIAVEHANQVTRTEINQATPMRTYATISVGYLEKSSVANTQTHPQVVQKNNSGEIITENKRVGLTHSEKLNPQHEKKLPPVLKSYFVGLDMEQKKSQYCYHFDASYTPKEIAQYKENYAITKYFNDNPQIRDQIQWHFAYIRGLEHQKEMEKILPASNNAIKELEERIKNK